MSIIQMSSPKIRFLTSQLRLAFVAIGFLPLAGLMSLSETVAAQDPKRTPPKAKPAELPKEVKEPTLLTEEQKKIRAAVQKGVYFLRATQQVGGTWNPRDHSVGYAAMPALALLEVGVPASDPAVQWAAYHVRAMSPKLDSTYELGLAILFLDKLGDSRDLLLIRVLAMRLIAGQTANGGWSYKCPLLNLQEGRYLVYFLHKNQPQMPPGKNVLLHPHLTPLPPSLTSLVDPITRREKDFSMDPLGQGQSLFDKLNPLPTTQLPKQPKELKLDLFDPIAKPPGAKDKDKDIKFILPLDDKLPPPPMPKDEKVDDISPEKKSSSQAVPSKSGGKDEPTTGSGKEKPTDEPVVVDIDKWANVSEFMMHMRYAMFVQTKGKSGNWKVSPHDDNSNTQFALLGLWAARRHGVPVTLTLTRLDERFRSSQNKDGSWAYHFDGDGKGKGKGRAGGGTPAMTCVGLLGLGVAHGAFQDAAKLGQKPPGPGMFFFDPDIQKGLAALSQSVGGDKNRQTGPVSLYFLWSLERIGVMYHLPTLRLVDWHAWGTGLLLPRQTASGSWKEGGYPGSSETLDTAMALLFLARINLARDLSDSLRQNIVVLDPIHTH